MRLLAILSCLLFHFPGLSQSTPGFKQELKSLDSMLRKTRSFKEQIRGSKLQNYEQKLSALYGSTDTTHSWQRFMLLTELVKLIRDNHFALYQKPDYSLFKTKAGIDSLFKSDYYSDWPVTHWNIDSLREILSKKPAENIEGIFHYGSHYSMGLVKTAEQQYQGVALESAVSYIKTGQVIAWLTKKENGHFSAVYLHPLTHNFIYYPIEKYADGQLLYSSFYLSYYKGNYSKSREASVYVNLPDTAHPFLISTPSDSVLYVRVSSFANNGVLRKQSDSLLQLIKKAPLHPYTIFDLRNNTGGSGAMAKPYINWIKQVHKKSRVAVLINANTVSQGEITAIQLSRLKGLTIAGRQTKGMLAYGSNYGKHIPLAGGEIVFYPTDMRNGGLLPFEDIGVSPAVVLTNEKDWIMQLMEYWHSIL